MSINLPVLPMARRALTRTLLLVAVLMRCLEASTPAATYYVATNGSDSNSGLTTSLPWQTLTKAANTLAAGDTVFIRGGVYRETIVPANSGTSTGLITYSAYNGEEVIVSGADVFTGWVQQSSDSSWRVPFTLSLPVSSPDYSWSSTDVSRRREMVIFDDTVLVPVTARSLLVPGTFWADGTSDGTTNVAIYAKFPGSSSPSGHTVECATRSFGLYMDTKSYTRFYGITFRYSCNKPLGDYGIGGMVFLGHSNTRVTLDSCTVEKSNAGGITAGFYTNPYQSTYLTVTNCNVWDNGQIGFLVSANDSSFVNLRVMNNNWKNFSYTWEAGGGKWSNSSRNAFSDIESGSNEGPGLWLDGENYGNVIERCLVYDNRFAGIDLESNSNTNIVRNNAISYTRRHPYAGAGILVFASGHNSVVNNTCFSNEGDGIYVRYDSSRVGYAPPLQNDIFNNICAFNGSNPDGATIVGYEMNDEGFGTTYGGNLFRSHSGSEPSGVLRVEVVSNSYGYTAQSNYQHENDFALWQSLTGDTSSALGDPLLANRTNFYGFHLTSSSPARGLGVTPPVTVSADYDLDSRPSSGADSGADQFSSSTNNPIYQINAGGSAISPFGADNYYTGGAAYTDTDTVSTTGVTNAGPAAMYQTVRANAYGTLNSFSYIFPGLTSSASYTVRLHFAETWNTAANVRKFNVAINGSTVLSNFDVFADAGGANKAVVKSFNATADSSGEITATFSNLSGYDSAIVCGLEIIDGSSGTPPSVSLTAPANNDVFPAGSNITLTANASDTDGSVTKVEFYQGSTKLGEDNASPFVLAWNNVTAGNYALTARAIDNSGLISTSSVVNISVKTVVYQINAGGGAVSPFAADNYSTGGNSYTDTDTVSTTGVSFPAPAAVYQTVRANTYGTLNTFSYALPGLTSGATYMVRLHFAETWNNAANVRKFNVSINSTQVLSNFDIFAAAGGQNKALVSVFSAVADGTGKITISFANVSGYDSALVCGIELWR